MPDIDSLRFLSDEQVRSIASSHPTPFYVYSKSELVKRVHELEEAFAAVPFGITIRYAMKANPNSEILKLFDGMGLHIDASSEYEANDAIEAGIEPRNILLTSQQLPHNIKTIARSGIHFTATSLHQLEQFGKIYPRGEVSIRLNTGIGSGYIHRLTTGGIEVGFGIWYHKGDTRSLEIHEVIDRYKLVVKRVHLHVGTGTDPAMWARVMEAGLDAARDFKTADTLNLGGGFKIAYMKGDHAADIRAIGDIAAKMLTAFYNETGRKLRFEIEPGRYLTAEAGSIVSTIIDRTDTGDNGDDFLKLDCGMTEFIRTAMYGANHPLVVVPKRKRKPKEAQPYVVIGHCCESSDVFTVVPGKPDEIQPRMLAPAEIGDYMVIEKTGAYCASMSTKGYNSFPHAREVFVD